MAMEYQAARRHFLRTSAIAGATLIGNTPGAFAQLAEWSRPTKGDVAILRFLSAVEQIESDLWLQYNELGGIQDSEVPAAAAMVLTPRRSLISMGTCLSISTIIPRMNSLTTHSLTPIFSLSAQGRSI